MKRVAVIGGDGIGPEVVAATIPVIDRVLADAGDSIDWRHLPYGADHYLDTGETLPEAAFEHIRDDADAILLGALGDPRVPSNVHARDILLGLRFKLDLYINFRPCRLLHPSLCPLRTLDVDRPIDFVIFRENTEGSYLGRGSSENEDTDNEIQISEEVHSAPKVHRIVEAAFEWARANSRSHVTMSDKSNAIPAHRLWGRIFEEVGEHFPEIDREHRYIDALAMELVRDPQRFEVIVTNNLYGDIISDLGAQLVGGMGLAASANLHPGRPGLFEPVHGSAPPLAGKNVANPLATMLTGALMLEQLGHADAALRIEHAVAGTVEAGNTPEDLGGSLSTREVADSVLSML
ncbi:MAG: isocitrate/isopropylmalate dehydrogenase family protein [Gemmatimonadales bacterium]